MSHQLILGDAIESLLQIPDGSVDMVLADLPYGTTRNDFDKRLDLSALWPEYLRVCKPNAAILLFGQSPFDKMLWSSNPNMFRYEWIWEKTQATGHLNANKMPMKAHENILVFYKSLPTYNPLMTHGHDRKVSSAKNRANAIIRKKQGMSNYGHEYEDKVKTYDSTSRYPRSVLKFKSDKQKSCYHPQQKPVSLLEYFIKTYTNEGETVLDNTCGSGSTGVACEKTGRNSILIDNNPVWIPIIEERLKTLI